MPAEFSIARQLFLFAKLRADALRARKDNQWGASAVEWAVISAIVVVAAVTIGLAISTLVGNKKNDLCEGAQGGC